MVTSILIKIDDARAKQGSTSNITGVCERTRSLCHGGNRQTIHLELLVREWRSELNHTMIVPASNQGSVHISDDDLKLPDSI